ncbi:MAG: hypothetical protein CM1200mP34_4250 [Verrucomicrobiales bacterium]|nr:MAG: hypothetical protein CM1200mP34_4250 [Verrucomicrobiales bacterium]
MTGPTITWEKTDKVVPQARREIRHLNDYQLTEQQRTTPSANRFGPDFGRKEIDIAEKEMPGLWPREKSTARRNRSTASRSWVTHMTVQTAVLIRPR